MVFHRGGERSRVCVCMTHVALPGTNYARDVDISMRVSDSIYGSGRPFIQLLSNGLVI